LPFGRWKVVQLLLCVPVGTGAAFLVVPKVQQETLQRLVERLGMRVTAAAAV